MSLNAKASEQVAILDVIAPSSQAAGAAGTGWVSVGQARRLLAIVQTGVLGAAATVDAKLQQAQDNAGTGAKDVPGAAIVQIVKATGDNKQAKIDCQVGNLDANNGFAFVKLSITVGVAASQTAGLLLAVHPRYEPAAAMDNASVVQTVG